MNSNETTGLALSSKQLLLSLLIALAAGAGITYFIVLPMEDTLQPKELTVTIPSESPVAETPAAVDTAPQKKSLYIAIDPALTPGISNEFGEPQPVLDGVNIRQHPAPPKTSTVTIALATDEQVEYKALMEEGEVLLYSWQADGELYFDFHAHQEDGDAVFFTRYAEGESNSDQGSIVAPYAGQHGWYWLNIAGKPVNVELSVSGYFQDLVKIDMEAEE